MAVMAVMAVIAIDEILSEPGISEHRYSHFR